MTSIEKYLAKLRRSAPTTAATTFKSTVWLSSEVNTNLISEPSPIWPTNCPLLAWLLLEVAQALKLASSASRLYSFWYLLTKTLTWALLFPSSEVTVTVAFPL